MTLIKFIANSYPKLKANLMMARLNFSDEQYIKKVIFTSFLIALSFSIYLLIILSKWLSFFFFPLYFLLLWIIFFLYLMKYPEVKKFQILRQIDRELVFAIRYIIIELESSVSIYRAFQGLKENYPVVGSYTQEIINQVDLGTDIEIAISKVLKIIPSENFKKVLYQILTAIQTGTNVATTLRILQDQIVQEQQIEIKEYGRKLNSFAMLFMMIAIVLPSLGMSIAIVFSIFIGFQLNITFLLVIAVLMAFIQYMFLSMIRTSRPAVDL